MDWGFTLVSNRGGDEQAQFRSHRALDAAMNQMASVLMSRAGYLTNLFDPRRNIDHDCGWPDVVTPQMYKTLCDRSPIASRANDLWPDECWRVQPQVYEKEQGSVATPFEKAWDALGSGMRGELSWYQDEQGSLVYKELHDLDRKAGIGCSGAMFLGLDDGLPYSQPAAMMERRGAGVPARKLLFVRSFSEADFEILEVERDRSSPRFSQPTIYKINFNAGRPQYPTSVGGSGGAGSSYGGGYGPGTSLSDLGEDGRVHWSRVIQVPSDNGGRPRLQECVNDILDLRKVYGASAEAYWLSCFATVFLSTHPQLGGDVPVNIDAIRNMMENIQNSMQRWGFLRGMSPNVVAPNVADAASRINLGIQAICIKLGVAQRLFMGSERGELSSGQDATEHHGRTQGRRDDYCTPSVLGSFVDRCIALGVLPEPGAGWHAYWPDEGGLSDTERVAIAQGKMAVIVEYATKDGASVMTEEDMLTRVLWYSDEEAATILDNKARADEEKKLAEEQQRQDNIDAGLNPDGTAIQPLPAPASQPGTSGAAGPASVVRYSGRNGVAAGGNGLPGA